MRTRPVLLTALAPILALAACATSPSGSDDTRAARVENARPEPDPGARATPQGPLAISGVERVVVKLEPAAGGLVRVVEFLSPDLTEAEKLELEEAIERGELRPETGPERTGTTWTTTVVRRRR